MRSKYDPQQIEAKWQRVWEDERAFHTPNPAPGEEADERHWYQLEMLPYPSGTLHMGHVLNYTMGDVLTHLRRRSGWTVLRPMGFDSFGLPAENAAIREGGHPREITERNIVDIREQMKRLGWAIDWDREVSAHQPEFYRWTQWLFLRFFERGLAYRKAAPVNWCPNDQTVVANEYVIDGRCERCGAEVEARNLEQWFFKITDYADELLEYDLPPGGDWPERTKTIQRNWIGRSEGAEILFRVDELDERHPRLHDAAGHAVRRDVLRARARASARRAHRQRRGSGVREADGGAARRGARGRGGEDGRLHRSPRDQSRQRRAAARLRRRLRADGVRHRRDHGRARARRARPRVRRGVRPADRRGDHRGRRARQLGRVRRPARRRGEGRDRRVAPRARDGRAGRLLPPPRLELLAAALLGLPDPDRLLRRLRHGPRPRRRAAGAAARGRRLPAEGRAAARVQRGVAARAVPEVRQAGHARGRHDGHVRRLVLVLPALRRSAQRRRAVRPRARRLLVPDRPVHRRHRPRDRATCSTRASS